MSHDSIETRLLPVDPDRPDPAAISEAAGVIRRGGLVAFPTETVYGLGADATSAAAVERIYAAKGRPARNPIIVHLADAAAARALVADWPAAAQALAQRFWPGPLTIVVPKSSIVPDVVTARRHTVALRCPANPIARALLAAAQRPIAAPSANLSERLSPTTAQHVRAALWGRIDLILDGGPTTVGIESTVVDLSVSPPALLRPGAVTLTDLQATIGAVVAPAPPDQLPPSVQPPSTAADHCGHVPLASPGMMPRHYAPCARLICAADAHQALRIIRDNPNRTVGRLRFGLPDQAAPGDSIVIDMPTDPAAYAARLYAALHELDAAGVDLIVAELPPATEPWRAVRDRLTRASSGK